MLRVTGLAETASDARSRIDGALGSGRAAELFDKMVAALGGPTRFIEQPERYLPVAPVRMPLFPDSQGYLCAVDVRAVGNAVILLGGGRRKADDRIDHSVGFTANVPIGAYLDRTTPLAIVHASSEGAAQQASAAYKRACVISAENPGDRPIVLETLSAAAPPAAAV
jgi:thymidine phosphorylase